MAKKTLDDVLAQAQAEGWIGEEEAAAFRKHHADSDLSTVIRAIADEASLNLSRHITKELSA